MPIFLGDGTEQLALMYCTCSALFPPGTRKALALYTTIRASGGDWEADLADVAGLPRDRVRQIRATVERSWKRLQSRDIVLVRGMPRYPRRLQDVSGAPEVLWCRGDVALLDEAVVAVVGTRMPTEAGKRDAASLARGLAGRYVLVASGLARGIDRAAHEGALEGGGWTLAVLGTPLDRVYPAEHKDLQRRIAEHGLLVSQFAPGDTVQRWNFPQRNVTMAALSDATIVVEAGETSGALIQARAALRLGRWVFVPKSAVDNPMLRWPRDFVQRRGAKAFQDVADVMEIVEQATQGRPKNRQSMVAAMRHVPRV